MNNNIEALPPLDVEEIFFIRGVCNVKAAPHCITCSDEALLARVLQIDEQMGLAQVEVENQVTEIDVSLIDRVEVGQTLLVHGGVALERLDGG